MRSHPHPHTGLAVVVVSLLLATLACSAVNDILPGNPAGTAQAVVTQPGDVDEAIETVEAIATDVDSSGLEATAEALATEVGSGDIEATAEALATEVLPGLGDVPEDIPIVEGETENFFAMEGVVSYSTAMEFAEVVDFYKTEMIEKGWEFVQDMSVETTDAAVLNYDQPDQSAIVTISRDPATDQTYVQVLIQVK